MSAGSDFGIAPEHISLLLLIWKSENAFLCSALTQLIIPSSIVLIDNYAFKNCSSLKQIVFCNPSSLTKIGEFSFSECSSLVKIAFPSSLKYIGDYAFKNCSLLKQIEFNDPSRLLKIGCYCFDKCTSLKQINIPSSIKVIGKYAFSSCSSLTKISIPSSIDSDYLGIDSKIIETRTVKRFY